ncbi:MAG TPA: TolC family protein [Thermoanaerobaculia bacterium]|nr:TolC family protein [Thermoanaerobaculia bacterium]
MRQIAGSFFIAAAWAGAEILGAQTPPPPPPPPQPVPTVQSAPGGKVIMLSLEEALHIGSGESETVWVAEAGVMRAVGTEIVSRSGLLPQLSGTATYTRTLRSQYAGLFNNASSGQGGNGGIQNLPFGRTNQYTLGLNFSQFVFDGGQTLARLRASQARRRSAEIDVDAQRAETLLDLTSAYFDALLSEQLVTIAEASLAQQEELLRQTTVAFQVGDKSEFEQLQARVSRDNQVPMVLQSRSRRQEAYLRLKQLLNVPLEDDLRLTTPLEELPARFATPSDLSAGARAPVRQAEEEVQANKDLLSGARAERWPSISVSSRYSPVAYPANGFPQYGDFREDWTVSVNLSIPILTGGRIVGDQLVARGNLSESQARLKQAREAAELDVRTSQLDLSDAQAILKSNESTVEQAKRGYEIAQIRFREGISSQIELQNARLLFEQAEVNRAQALRNVQVARARLALIRDLPLTAAGSQAAAQLSGASTGAASSGMPAQTSQPNTTTMGTTTGTAPAGAAGAAVPGQQPPGGAPL